jgi:hypothetical protein
VCEGSVQMFGHSFTMHLYNDVKDYLFHLVEEKEVSTSTFAHLEKSVAIHIYPIKFNL